MTKEIYSYIWEFIVRDETRERFEEIYGPKGDWAKLFQRSPGYLGTDLIRDKSQGQRYLTIDRWQSFEHFLVFKKEYQAEYQILDEICERLTLSERELGEFSYIT